MTRRVHHHHHRKLQWVHHHLGKLQEVTRIWWVFYFPPPLLDSFYWQNEGRADPKIQEVVRSPEYGENYFGGDRVERKEKIWLLSAKVCSKFEFSVSLKAGMKSMKSKLTKLKKTKRCEDKLEDQLYNLLEELTWMSFDKEGETSDFKDHLTIILPNRRFVDHNSLRQKDGILHQHRHCLHNQHLHNNHIFHLPHPLQGPQNDPRQDHYGLQLAAVQHHNYHLHNNHNHAEMLCRNPWAWNIDSMQIPLRMEVHDSYGLHNWYFAN